jgi:SAM-dependent methyltransferase
MEYIRKFYDAFEPKLLNDFVRGNRRINEALTFTKSALNKMKPRRILDIGCGLGWTSYEFARAFPSAEVHGVDLSENLLRAAGNIFKRPNLHFFQADVSSQLGVLTGKYDAVVLIDVFEHIPSPARSAFYAGVKNLLDHRFVLLLTCPTKHHQRFLRVNHPDRLQPVDEDVDLGVLQCFAESVDAEVTCYLYKDVWRNHDYLHASISSNIAEGEPVHASSLLPHLSPGEKLRLLDRSGLDVSLYRKQLRRAGWKSSLSRLLGG